MMLLATSSLTLTACASSPANNPTAVATSDVVTTTKVVTQMVCPAELDQPTPAQPDVPVDAVVTTNPSGAAYMADLTNWGLATAKLFGDAKTACQAATAPQAVSAAPGVAP